MNRYTKVLISMSCALSAVAALAGPPPAALQTSRLHAPLPAVAPVTPGSTQQLNPQPLPPKNWAVGALNPQPLPPKVSGISPAPLPPINWGTQQ
jgi:hypothetical protein